MQSNLQTRVQEVEVNFGGDPVFSNISFNLHEGDKISLVGRNGCGKSTLFKVIAGDIEPDHGEIDSSKGLRVAYLGQKENFDNYRTLGDFASRELGDSEKYLVDQTAQLLGFDPDALVNESSGGEKRKAALARVFAKERDVYLLDEPTNHLDINAILWLEETIKTSAKTFVVISHDRKLLSNMGGRAFWLDRGKLRICPYGYGRFEEWQEEILDLENTHRTKLDRRIRTETLWSREGISARRKRNQGRLKALEKLREKRAEFAQRETTFSVNINQPKSDTQMVLEAFNIDKSLGGKEIIRDFSLRILKGDRIAIVGPNGAGKSTLLKSLTKEIGVDQGKVRLGYNFDLAAMWQDRTLENLNISVQEFLVGKGANTRDQPDQVIFQGRSLHIISYIKKFQFEYWKAKSPLKSLSGGELGRMLLAKIFLRESNFLALDEPTNDLDVETLDMLKEILANYKGTVAFVSHDRDFIDNVANITIAYEGNGKWQAYSGGWSDYLKQKKNPANIGNTYFPTAKIQKKKERTAPKSINGNLLSFTERHRLEILPDLIENKEARISELTVKLEDPNLYSNNSSLFDELTNDLVVEQAKLVSLEEDWYQLASKQEE